MDILHTRGVLALIATVTWGCSESRSTADAQNNPPSQPQRPATTQRAVELTVLPDSALKEATSNGDLAIVEAALSRGADINRKSDDMTPLMRASVFGHLAVVEALVRHGAALDIEDGAGGTAVLYAETARHPDVVVFLKSKGAAPTTMDRGTAAMWVLSRPSAVFDYLGERAKPQAP